MVFPMKISCDTTILHCSLSKWNTNASKAKAEYEKYWPVIALVLNICKK